MEKGFPGRFVGVCKNTRKRRGGERNVLGGGKGSLCCLDGSTPKGALNELTL